MSDPDTNPRLETLWAGEFGDAYIDRNRDAEVGRRSFWEEHLRRLNVTSALEVGCNIGGNLRWIAELLEPKNVAGVDVNRRAIELLREKIPGVDARLASGTRLPFNDEAFDLVFTTGVLIHQDPATQLEPMMCEVVRVARRFVIAGEYFAEEPVEVPYRNQEGALFKRDFGSLYQQLFPNLKLVDDGFLSPREGRWDDLTYWIFRKG